MTVYRFALPLAALLLGACSLSPAAKAPDESPAREAPTDGDDAGRHDGPEWWKAFGDPVLDRVADAVLASNFDLEEAVARVGQARARARIARADRLPTVQASLGATDFDAPTNAGIGAQLNELGLGSDVFGAFGFALPDRLDLSTYTAGAEFAYEVDFWGRNRNAALAAGAERLAAEADLGTARINVLAETVGTYLEVVDQRRQRSLAGELVSVLREWERLTTSRYDSGLTDARGLYALRRNVRDAEAELSRVEGLLAGAEGRLWVLVGGYRAELADMLPDELTLAAAPEPVPEAVPADLLAQRPDVHAARQRVEAARFALGAHRAALLPSLSLSGSIGVQSSESSEWFDPDQWFRNLSVNLLAPVLQGGRLRGNVALAEARLDEAVAAFGRSVVTAANEVRSALAALESSRRRLAALAAMEQAARDEAALQRERYVSGVEDYAGVLSASQILVRVQSVLAGGERDLGFARLKLHRALGGAWDFGSDGVPGARTRASARASGAVSTYTPGDSE